MNVFALSRYFWDFSFENTGKIKPIHVSIYFFAIEHCNRLGWKKQFGLPTSMVLEAISVKSYSVYKSAFDDLVKYGFFEVVQYSKNQYSSNIIALKENLKADDKALDKALLKHTTKQRSSTVESKLSIDIPINKLTNNKQTIESEFEAFWNIYKKSRSKSKCFSKWEKLDIKDRKKIFETLPEYVKSTPDVKFRKDPLTYLNGECWNDEIISNSLNNFGHSESLPNFI